MRSEKERRKEKELKAMAVFGIYLMISLTVVSAYAMREYNGIQTDLKGEVSTVLMGFLNFMLPSVSAATGCCIVTTSGEYCKEGVQSSDCATGYYGGKCSDVPNGECNLGTCIQQNGDCDAQTFKKKCGDSFGFWNPATLLEINSCTPTCCIFTKENIVVDAQWVFFKNKCEKNPLVKDGSLDVTTQDITYKACKESIPPKTTGYCTLTAKAECQFMAKSECDAQNGDFSSKKCASCKPNSTLEAYNGNQGYGVYNFDSCKGPENIVESCGIEEIVENVNGVPHCVLKRCNLNIPFTNLNYDMAFFKKGNVEVNGALKSTPYSLSLDQGSQACVNFEGPGEQHYAATCQLGELMVFGMDESREKICRYGAGITSSANNLYQKCSECTDTIMSKTYSKWVNSVFNFLGADLLNIDWWDYWSPGQNAGMCDKDATCEALGDCVRTENNDCVPRYAPANSDICGECMDTRASSPWSKCGEEVQCTSRGNCQQVVYKQNMFAGITICAIETITQQGMLYGIQKIMPKSVTTKLDELKKTTDENQAKVDESRAKSKSGWTNIYNRLRTIRNGIVSRAAEYLSNFFSPVIQVPKAKSPTTTPATETAETTEPAAAANVEVTATANKNTIAPDKILSGTVSTGDYEDAKYNFELDKAGVDSASVYSAQLGNDQVIKWDAGRNIYYVNDKIVTDIKQTNGIQGYFTTGLIESPRLFLPKTTSPNVPGGAESVTTTGQVVRGFTGDAVAPSPTLGQPSGQTTQSDCVFTVIVSTLPSNNASTVIELNHLNNINNFNSRVVATKVYRNCVCNVQTKRYEQCIDESRRYVESTTFTDPTGAKGEINRLNNLNINCKNSDAKSKVLDPRLPNTNPNNLICLSTSPDILIYSPTWKKTEVYHPGEKVTDDFMAKYCTADTSKLNVCDKARLAALITAPATPTSQSSTTAAKPAETAKPVVIDEAAQNEDPETALPVYNVSMSFKNVASWWFFKQGALVLQVDYLGETETITIKPRLFGSGYMAKVVSTYPGTKEQLTWDLGIDVNKENFKGTNAYDSFEKAVIISRGNKIMNYETPTGYSYGSLYYQLEELSGSNDAQAKAFIANLPNPTWLMKVIPALQSVK